MNAAWNLVFLFLALDFCNCCVVVFHVHQLLILQRWPHKMASHYGGLLEILARNFASLLGPCKTVCLAFGFPHGWARLVKEWGGEVLRGETGQDGKWRDLWWDWQVKKIWKITWWYPQKKLKNMKAWYHLAISTSRLQWLLRQAFWAAYHSPDQSLSNAHNRFFTLISQNVERGQKLIGEV